MKKFISLLTLMFAFIAISSGQAIAMTGSGDSLSNTASKSCTFRAVGTPTSVSIEYVLTKASGTVAGKTYLYGSLDGVTYVAIDSMTATNQTTNAKIFIVTSPKAYVYYKTTHTGVGTMKVYLKALILVRKE